MILKLYTYDYFFLSSSYKVYAVEQDGNPDIEAIHYLGEELDLTDPHSYDLAIDFLNDCKECDGEICNTCKSTISEILFGTTFISNLEKIHDIVNETTDKIIELLVDVKNTLLADDELPSKCCEDCRICVDGKCCASCQEAEKASEAVSATGTCHWAQKYMDTIIDPASELSAAEYNTLLAMFTQYGEWLLKQ